MTDTSEKHLSARVRVPAIAPLEVFANRFSEMMPGFNFEEELTGRYEEIPAFVAENDSMSFTLLGIPKGEPLDTYVLDFDCMTDLSIDALLDCDAGGFTRQFVKEKPSKNGFFVDFSQELAHLLVQRGILGCEPILPVS
jgi:hypothetical protein